MVSPLAFEVPAFLLGLLFGSFLNVCISRLPRHEGIARGRSHCPHCGHTIRAYDNIPLLSWIFLAAKCRDCKGSIPWRYPAVELAVGVWFTITAHRLFVAIQEASLYSTEVTTERILYIVGGLILGFLLIGLLVMDWQTFTLPDAFTFSGIGIGFFLVCVQAIFLGPGEDEIKLNPKHSLRMSSPGSFAAKGNVFLTGPEHLVMGRLAAILIAALILYLIRASYKAIRNREGLGLGDVKLIAMIAAFLGLAPAALALFAACVLILPYALFLVATRRAGGAARLPFGSFLCAGGLIAALFAEPILNWYTSLF